MFGLLSKAEQTRIIQENAKLKSEIGTIKEKYEDGKVYTKEQYDSLKEDYNDLQSRTNDKINSLSNEKTKIQKDLMDKIDSLQKKLEGREAALMVLAKEMNVDDIEYFIRKDIKGFEDFKKDFVDQQEKDNKLFTAQKEAELEKEFLGKQSELLTKTSTLIFSRNVAGRALGSQQSSSTVE